MTEATAITELLHRRDIPCSPAEAADLARYWAELNAKNPGTAMATMPDPEIPTTFDPRTEGEHG